MPIYEYQCRKCGEIHEVFQKFSDAPRSRCDACGGRLEKLISHSSFQLKGTGWYATDYKGKGERKPDAARKEGGQEKEAKASTSEGST